MTVIYSKNFNWVKMLHPEQNPACEIHGCRHLLSPQWLAVHRAFSRQPSNTQHGAAIQPATEPPSHSLPFMCFARFSEKDSKEIIRTENQETRYLNFPERAFSARGWREELGLEREDRDGLSIFLAKAAQEPWGGGGQGLKINKPWIIAYIRIFWFPEWKPEFAYKLHPNV